MEKIISFDQLKKYFNKNNKEISKFKFLKTLLENNVEKDGLIIVKTNKEDNIQKNYSSLEENDLENDEKIIGISYSYIFIEDNTKHFSNNFYSVHFDYLKNGVTKKLLKKEFLIIKNLLKNNDFTKNNFFINMDPEVYNGKSIYAIKEKKLIFFKDMIKKYPLLKKEYSKEELTQIDNEYKEIQNLKNWYKDNVFFGRTFDKEVGKLLSFKDLKLYKINDLENDPVEQAKKIFQKNKNLSEDKIIIAIPQLIDENNKNVSTNNLDKEKLKNKNLTYIYNIFEFNKKMNKFLHYRNESIGNITFKNNKIKINYENLEENLLLEGKEFNLKNIVIDNEFHFYSKNYESLITNHPLYNNYEKKQINYQNIDDNLDINIDY